MNIYQSNTYKNNFSWLDFDNEPRVQERQQVKDQQFYILVSVAYVTYPYEGRVIRPIKLKKLSFPSIEINEPLSAPVYNVLQAKFKFRS